MTLNEIKQRLFDQANQDLMMSINTSTRLDSYCIFKEDTKLEPYIDIIKSKKFRFALSKFRLSSHSLAIEVGRYPDTPRHQRICTFCNMNVIENEFHFLLACPNYIDIRRKYLPAYYCTRVVPKVPLHSLFCHDNNTSELTTFMITKHFI